MRPLLCWEDVGRGPKGSGARRCPAGSLLRQKEVVATGCRHICGRSGLASFLALTPTAVRDIRMGLTPLASTTLAE